MVRLFREWDVDGDGRVTKPEFKRALAYLGYKTNKAELDLIFGMMDMDGSGEIEYTELNQLMARSSLPEDDPSSPTVSGRDSPGLGGSSSAGKLPRVGSASPEDDTQAAGGLAASRSLGVFARLSAPPTGELEASGGRGRRGARRRRPKQIMLLAAPPEPSMRLDWLPTPLTSQGFLEGTTLEAPPRKAPPRNAAPVMGSASTITSFSCASPTINAASTASPSSVMSAAPPPRRLPRISSTPRLPLRLSEKPAPIISDIEWYASMLPIELRRGAGLQPLQSGWMG